MSPLPAGSMEVTGLAGPFSARLRLPPLATEVAHWALEVPPSMVNTGLVTSPPQSGLSARPLPVESMICPEQASVVGSWLGL